MPKILVCFLLSVGSNENTKLSISLSDLLSADEKGIVFFFICLHISRARRKIEELHKRDDVLL